MDNLHNRANFEANVWTFTAIFKTCKDRAIKNSNWSQAASANTTDEEIKQFTNCVTKSFKAVALYPSISE